MNERIKKLYEQSLIRETGKDHAGNPMLVIKQNPERFAELIIKETLQVARAGIEFGSSMEEAVHTYFGLD